MAKSHKACPRCGELKPIFEFGRNKTRPDGFAFYCKACCRSKANAHYRSKREAQGLKVRPRESPPPGQKWCPDCQAYVLIENFNRNAAARDGRNSYASRIIFSEGCVGTLYANTALRENGSKKCSRSRVGCA